MSKCNEPYQSGKLRKRPKTLFQATSSNYKCIRPEFKVKAVDLIEDYANIGPLGPSQQFDYK